VLDVDGVFHSDCGCFIEKPRSARTYHAKERWVLDLVQELNFMPELSPATLNVELSCGVHKQQTMDLFFSSFFFFFFFSSFLSFSPTLTVVSFIIEYAMSGLSFVKTSLFVYHHFKTKQKKKEKTSRFQSFTFFDS